MGPTGMLSLATCSTTVQNKLEMGEDPLTTVKILEKWKCDLCELECHWVRLLLYTLDDNDPTWQANVDIIEFFFSRTSIPTQNLDCRAVDEEYSLLCVSCPRSVDFSINLSFCKLNALRDKQREDL